MGNVSDCRNASVSLLIIAKISTNSQQPALPPQSHDRHFRKKLSEGKSSIKETKLFFPILVSFLFLQKKSLFLSSNSGVDIFKKSVSIRYDIFENLYRYINILKMSLFREPISYYEYFNKNLVKNCLLCGMWMQR